MLKKTAIATALATAMGVSAAEAGTIVFSPVALSTDAANFTLLDSQGTTAGGTNDVNMLWDGTLFTANSDYTGPGSTANITVSSTTPFFGHNWAAHDIQAFNTGTYTFDTTLGGGNPETGSITLKVGAGQIGMHMLFDWKSLNIDMVVLLEPNAVFGAGEGFLQNKLGGCKDALGQSIIGNQCLWVGEVFGSQAVLDGIFVDGAQTWGLASVDQAGGDGIPGTPMAPGGPFADFNASFSANLAPIPVPAAAWLFGSGLAALIGGAWRIRRVQPTGLV